MRVAQVLSEGESQGFAYGTIMHAWLALIDWLDDGPLPDETRLREAISRLEDVDFTPSEIDSLIGEFRAVVARPAVAELLRRGYYRAPRDGFLASKVAQTLHWQSLTAEVCCERRFALRRGERMVTGSIDRLVLLRDSGRIVAADVLDFKTDAVTPSERDAFDARVAFYTPQLAEYRRVVSELLQLEPERIAARLVFLKSGAIVPVELEA